VSPLQLGCMLSVQELEGKPQRIVLLFSHTSLF
jgi:hypothetical protein